MEVLAAPPPYPQGWYAVGFSAELERGEILTRSFMDGEVVLFRTESGAAHALSPQCPHLGAHLGVGSTVEGETIRCPFHGFCFDGDGACVKTGYDAAPPKNATAHSLPIQEVNGLLLVYYDREGRDPTWHIPELEPGDWTPLGTRHWRIRGHPQETSENSVDIGHLSYIHGYTNVEMLKELRTEGPYLTAKYAMSRGAGIVGSGSLRAEFEVHVHGLGYSFVDVHVPEKRIHLRQFVLATPVGPEHIDLRIGLCVERLASPAKVNPVLALLPRTLSSKLVAAGALRGFANDIQQDFDIWQNKFHLPQPVLAKGDGPVGPYRRWVKQFYEDADPTAPALKSRSA